MSAKRAIGGALVVPFRLASIQWLARLNTGLEAGDLEGSLLFFKAGKSKGMKNEAKYPTEKLNQVGDRLKVLQATAVSPGEQANWCHQDEIIGILVTVTESLSSTVEVRRDEYSRVVERLSRIEGDLSHMRADIALLCKVVRDGNGQPSLIQRLANIEVVVANNKASLAEVQHHANTIIAAKALSKSQVVAGLIGMIVTALLSAIAIAVTLIK